MNKEQLRLINILKTNPELKDSIEELKFGCIIMDRSLEKNFRCVGRKEMEKRRYEETLNASIYISEENTNYVCTKSEELIRKSKLRGRRGGYEYEIIGQVGYNDLLYFLESAGLTISLTSGGLLLGAGEYIENIKFDLAKDLLSQKEYVLKKLNDFLQTLKK